MNVLPLIWLLGVASSAAAQQAPHPLSRHLPAGQAMLAPKPPDARTGRNSSMSAKRSGPFGKLRLTRDCGKARERLPARSRQRSAAQVIGNGRLFEYFRNDRLDAVPHEVVQRGGDRNLRRRNQFGFTVSGPRGDSQGL